MANDFEVSIDVAASPQRTWSIVGDPADLRWFAAVTSCRVEGDLRYAEMVTGASLIERIVEHDEGARSYSYSVMSGASTPMRSHRATIRVEETSGGSRIVWHTRAVPEDADVDVEARIGGALLAGLERAREMAEAA